jgi:hypothetical protein
MTYDLKLGPLAFPAPLENVAEAVADGLEAVGAALAVAERRTRPLKLKLAVHGEPTDTEPVAAGLRLRRQARQLLNNGPLRLNGLYLNWTPDAELDCWLMVGACELSETDPGVGFGEFDLTLTDVYLVGRPGTHRPGRRASITNMRTGTAPRDSRRLLYSNLGSAQALPASPLMLPGDVISLRGTGLTAPGAGTTGLARGSRFLWRAFPAVDAEVLSYVPAATVTGRSRFVDLDELGVVKVWDATSNPEPTFTQAGDEDPTVYGWERVYGDVLTSERVLALENGAARVRWMGAGAAQGLAIEYWKESLKRFSRIGRVLHALETSEQSVVELTGERGILEWRAGRYAMRAVLQRGWWGPRLESYDDGGSTARLEFAPTGSGAVTLTPQTPTWVQQITIASGGEALLWAQSATGETANTTPTVISGTAAAFSRTRVVLGQLSPPAGPTAEALASAAILDARPVPVLVGRG